MESYNLSSDNTGSNSIGVDIGSCGGSGNNVDIYLFTAPVAGTYFFESNVINLTDTVIYVRSHCDDTIHSTEHDCNDDKGDSNYGSYVEVNLSEGESAYVFVDSYGQSSSGDYIFQIGRL